MPGSSDGHLLEFSSDPDLPATREGLVEGVFYLGIEISDAESIPPAEVLIACHQPKLATRPASLVTMADLRRR